MKFFEMEIKEEILDFSKCNSESEYKDEFDVFMSGKPSKEEIEKYKQIAAAMVWRDQRFLQDHISAQHKKLETFIADYYYVNPESDAYLVVLGRIKHRNVTRKISVKIRKSDYQYQGWVDANYVDLKYLK